MDSMVSAASSVAQAVTQLAVDLALNVAIADLATAVAPFLAAGEGELDLRVRALEVDPGRDHRQALAL